MQPIAFALGTLLILKKENVPVKDALLLKKTEGRWFLLTLLLFSGLFFGVGSLNAKLGTLLEKAGVNVGGTIRVNGPLEYLSYLCSLCILPAVGEEFLFRGFLLDSLKNLSVKKDGEEDGTPALLASLLSAVLFALYHKNVAQLLYQFVYGFSLSMLTLKSKSLFPAIVAHALNNFVVLTSLYLFPTVDLFPWWGTVLGLILFAVVAVYFIKTREKGKGDYRGFAVGAGIGAFFSAFLAVLNATL